MRHSARTRSLPPATLLLLGAFWSTGCATVTNTPKQRIEILSQPSGARVTVAGQTLETPAFVELPRKDKELEIVVEMEGFAAQTVKLERKFSGTTLWSLAMIPAAGLAGYFASASDDSWGIGDEDATKGAALAGAATAGIMITTDLLNGSAYRLDPGRVVVELKPVSAVAALPATGLH